METILKPVASEDYPLEAGFVYGDSPAIKGLNAMVAELAHTDIPDLIVGESGTGKVIYATLLPRLSGASGAQPRQINCRLLEGERVDAVLREVFRTEPGSAGLESLFLD